MPILKNNDISEATTVNAMHSSEAASDVESGSVRRVESVEPSQSALRRKFFSGVAAGLAVAGVSLGVVGASGLLGGSSSSAVAETSPETDGVTGVQTQWFWDWWGKDPCQTVEPIHDVNLDEFVRATWYVQEQQVNTYQREDDLFCVAATYDQTGDEHVPFFDGNIISVYNYANQDYVNGEASNAIGDDGLPGQVLCARQPDESKNGELLVAPCWLPNLFGGDYWIVGLGEDNGEYEWAVISGGQPSVEYDDGCSTQQGYFNSGLWIFARDPILAPEKLAEARAAAVAQGFSLSQLKHVEQEGCNYEGAIIKA